jgi:hypothetical protein
MEKKLDKPLRRNKWNKEKLQKSTRALQKSTK